MEAQIIENIMRNSELFWTGDDVLIEIRLDNLTRAARGEEMNFDSKEPVLSFHLKGEGAKIANRIGDRLIRESNRADQREEKERQRYYRELYRTDPQWRARVNAYRAAHPELGRKFPKWWSVIIFEVESRNAQQAA